MEFKHVIVKLRDLPCQGEIQKESFEGNDFIIWRLRVEQNLTLREFPNVSVICISYFIPFHVTELCVSQLLFVNNRWLARKTNGAGLSSG